MPQRDMLLARAREQSVLDPLTAPGGSAPEVSGRQQTTGRTPRQPDLGVATLPAQRGRLRRLPGRPWGGPAWLRDLCDAILLGDAVSALVAVGATLLVWGVYGQVPTWGPAALATFVPAWLVVLALGRCFESRYLLAGADSGRRLADAALRLLAATALVAAIAPLAVTRLVALVTVPIALLAGFAVRAIAYAWVHHERRRGRAMQRTLVVGARDGVQDLVRRCAADPACGFALVGALLVPEQAEGLQVVPSADLPVVGTPGDAAGAVRQHRADTVLVAAGLDARELAGLCLELEGLGVHVYVAPSLSGVGGPRLHVRPVAGVPLLHVDEPELAGPRRILKSLFDRTLAATGLLVLSPLFLALVLAIRLDSPGPAFFRQTRVGRAGRSFTMWKFRSMVVDAEERRKDIEHLNDHGADHVLFKMKDDPRITRMGRALRRTSLDELPQLVNVLRGEMSLVGPRPPLPSEVERYAHGGARRLLVRPGLTGLWQVSGRSELSWEESLRLDLHYVENWSLLFDLHILWRTASAVLRRSGAY